MSSSSPGNGSGSGSDDSAAAPSKHGFAISRLNHAVLYVSDIDRAVGFYRDVLGFDVVQEVPGRAAFLRAAGSENHHDLGLFGLGPTATKPPGASVGLYHLAWQVATIDELATARHHLVEAGALVGQSDHGASKSLYAHDPDGNEFEIMWMVPAESWGDFESQAVVEPLDLDAEVRRWSGVATKV